MANGAEEEPDNKKAGPQLDDADPWVQIQAKTFKNWCNEQLKPVSLEITDIQKDFADGTLLIELMKCLMSANGRPLTARKKRIIIKKNPTREVEKMSNVQTAVDLMKEEGIKLVNIGNEDIVHGNIKLILGLLWQLVNTYQFRSGPAKTDKDGKQKRATPPKKLIQQWLHGILPEGVKCQNFKRDWNDGIVLSAMLNYCDPELFPDWQKLSSANSLANCEAAMNAAKDRFEIPIILSPQDLSNPEVDEQSVITYVSYFVQHEGPGWYATLNWIRSKVSERNVTNFQEDFNDGLVLCGLCHAVGGNCEGWQDLDPADKEANCEKGMISIVHVE